MTPDPILDDLARMWGERDPVPGGLVARMQAAAASEAALAEAELDYELMLLIERSGELAGVRGASTTSYTLRFAGEGLDLLLRVAQGGSEARLDGWVVPPGPLAVRAARVDDDATWLAEVDAHGRFEFGHLPAGLYRIWLTPESDEARPFGTPAFEI